MNVRERERIVRAGDMRNDSSERVEILMRK